METKNFETAVDELEQTAIKNTTAYMCAEAVWWRCHSSMVSDYLKAKGWTVLHIMAVGKIQDHTYTPPASKNEPQYEIKSSKTEYIAVHKGAALAKI